LKHVIRRLPIALLLLVSAVAAILCYRSHELLLAPTLRVEDGASIFGFFYSNREWQHLFRFKSGYMPLLPNILGYVSVRLPLGFSPYFLTIVPTLLSVLTYTFFATSRFRVLVSDDRLRQVTCLVLALVPVGQFFLVSHTDFSIWNTLFLATLWSFLPFPRSVFQGGSSLAAQQLLVWTNPLSFVLVPIHALHFALTRSLRERAFQMLMLAGHVLHVLYGFAPRHERQVLYKEWNLEILWEIAQRTYVHLAENALPRTLFGVDGADYVQNAAPSTSHVAFIVVSLGMLASFIWPSPQISRKLLVLLAYATVGIMLAVVLSRGDGRILNGRRYLYVQCLLLAMQVCLVVYRAVAELRKRVSSVGWFPQRNGRLPAWAFYALPLSMGATLQNSNQADAYRDVRAGNNAERVRRCMQRLEALEAEHGGPCGFNVTCKKRHDWAIRIKAPPCDE
jgi:hypothetical protein